MKKFIVSYPRSGNEWTRFLIANLIANNEEVTFSNVNAFVPDIHQAPDYRVYRLDGASFYKSHLREFNGYDDAKIVYLLRDGRDVAVSAYNLWCRENRLLKKLISWKDYLDIFLRGDLIFGKWKDHIWYWALHNNPYKFICVRYGDLVKDTEKELRRIAEFLDIPHDDGTIKYSVWHSVYDKMKLLVDPFNNSRVGSHGKPQSWKEVFDEEDRERYWTEFGEISNAVGYTKEQE